MKAKSGMQAFRANRTVSAMRRYKSELMSRSALFSFREFKDARPVVADWAGYPGVNKAAAAFST
jgi:hypothetical protein